MPMPSNYNSEYNNFTAITNLHNKIYNNVANVNENVNIVLRGSLVHSWGPPDSLKYWTKCTIIMHIS